MKRDRELALRLQDHPLESRESGRAREMHVFGSRSGQEIPLRIAVRAGGRNPKRSRVEPRRGHGRARTMWIQERITRQVHPVVVIAVQILIRAGSDVKRKTAL